MALPSPSSHLETHLDPEFRPWSWELEVLNFRVPVKGVGCRVQGFRERVYYKGFLDGFCQGFMVSYL